MPIHPRKIECDICGYEEEEPDLNKGFKGWSINKGIGAVEPVEDEPEIVANHQSCYCPSCTKQISDFITELQQQTVRIVS